MARNANDFERDAERHREQIRDSADELKRRLSPDTMVSEGLEYLRGPGGQRLVRAVQENPLAAIMAVAGAGWLMLTASRQDEGVRGMSTRQEVGPSATRPGADRPGVMGDQTQEQSLNQTGNPGVRVTQNEVRSAFGEDSSASR